MFEFQIPEGSRWAHISKQVGSRGRSLFRCSCGREKSVYRDNVARGKSMSCGCLARELFQGARDPLAISRQPLYAVWKAIWSRCTNPRNKAYKNYGERGVFVVDRWKDFWLFVSDMGQKPLPGREYSIDRKDNDGPYSPDNCCWSDRLRQANNQRRTVVVDFGGESRPLQDWCRELGIPASTIKSRVFQQGMTYQEAFRKSLP